MALWRLRPVLGHVPLLRRIYDGWARTHPFDVLHGTDTSGSSRVEDNVPDAAAASLLNAYAGSQPSIVRVGLAALPDLAEYAFVDVGCGKGRALIVASEFPFRKVIGVEISLKLAAIARANAAVIGIRYPRRVPIEIQVSDATAVLAPAEYVVFFMYHPFGQPLVSALIHTIEAQLGKALQHAFVVYYNPVHADAVDESPRFARWYAESLAYASDEVGFGPDLNDTVVIWQSLPERYPACPGAERRITVGIPSGFARLDNSPASERIHHHRQPTSHHGRRTRS